MDDRCETCWHFWLTSKSDVAHEGRCHRFPPVPLAPDSFLDRRWEWPVVPANGACGEHQKRK